MIKSIMRYNNRPVHLHREGIHYRQDGIDFIDTHYDFNRIVSAYLKCLKLYNDNNHTEGARVWRAELGHAQREVMWLVQRYCEIKSSFSHASADYKRTPFVRNFEIFHRSTRRCEQIFDTKTGEFIANFGLDNASSGFAILKGRKPDCPPIASRHPESIDMVGVSCNLVTVNRFIVDAFQNIDSRPVCYLSISTGKIR